MSLHYWTNDINFIDLIDIIWTIVAVWTNRDELEIF